MSNQSEQKNFVRFEGLLNRFKRSRVKIWILWKNMGFLAPCSLPSSLGNRSIVTYFKTSLNLCHGDCRDVHGDHDDRNSHAHGNLHQ
jgi:hypothetical protein